MYATAYFQADHLMRGNLNCRLERHFLEMLRRSGEPRALERLWCSFLTTLNYINTKKKREQNILSLFSLCAMLCYLFSFACFTFSFRFLFQLSDSKVYYHSFQLLSTIILRVNTTVFVATCLIFKLRATM